MAVQYFPKTPEGQNDAFAVPDPKNIEFDGTQFIVTSASDYSIPAEPASDSASIPIVYDQFGRKLEEGFQYEIPGFSGTPIDLAGSTFSNHTGATTITSNIPGIGTGLGVSLAITGSANAYSDITLGPAIPMDDMLMMTIDVYRAPSNATPALIKIFLDTEAGSFTNYWRAVALIEAIGNQRICIPRGAWLKNGTPTEATGFIAIRFRTDYTTLLETPPLPSGETILIGAMRKNPRTRAKLLISHDGGSSSLMSFYTKVASYGWKGVAYITTAYVGQTGYVTESNIATLKGADWTVGSHSKTHPADGLSNGMRLLGTAGIGISITSIDTGTDIITCATNRAPASTAAPIQFSATSLPDGISAATDYWPKKVTVSTFTIHPTFADAIAGTNKINITSSGTTVTFSYSGAVANETAIASDFADAKTYLQSLGLDGDHLALSQGATNYEVHKAIKSLSGIETVRGTYDENLSFSRMDGSPSPTFLGYPGATLGMYDITYTTMPPGKWMNLPALCSMEAGLTSSVTNFIDTLISTGATGSLLEHGYNSSYATAVFDYVKMKEEAGLIDIVTAHEWFHGVLQ